MISAVFSVIFAILKILLIIILSVISSVLLLVLVLLFVPVRYRADLACDSDNKAISGFIYAGWLLRLIGIRVDFIQNKPKIKFKIFGISPDGRNKKKNKKKNRTKNKKTVSNSDSENDFDWAPLSMESEEQPEAKSEKSPEQKPEQKPEVRPEAGSDGKPEAGSEARSVESSDKKQSFSDKLENIKNKYDGILDKIREISEAKNEFLTYYNKPDTREALRYLKLHLLKILSHIKPRRANVSIHYGFTDPAFTGQSFGLFCILGSQLYLRGSVTPQFTDVEKSFVRGKAKFKGHIRLAPVLYHALKIVLNKKIKEFIAFIKGWNGGKNGKN